MLAGRLEPQGFYRLQVAMSGTLRRRGAELHTQQQPFTIEPNQQRVVSGHVVCICVCVAFACRFSFKLKAKGEELFE